MNRTTTMALALACAFCTAGCIPVVLNVERTFDVPAGGGERITLDAVSRAQKIKVDFTATGGPVKVHVCLSKDAETAHRAFQNRKFGPPILAYEENSMKKTLEAEIPANESALVVFELASFKRASVAVKITN